MKFGHEYETALANDGFPQEWVAKAIEYKNLKKAIKKVHRELEELGLDRQTLVSLNELVLHGATPGPQKTEVKDYFAGSRPGLQSIPEEFTPQLRILVDGKTGTPLDAKLAPETKESLQRLARHEMVVNRRQEHIAEHGNTHAVRDSVTSPDDPQNGREDQSPERSSDAKWVTVPLSSAKAFFEMLEPKLMELDSLRDSETQNLEEEILDLGEAVENVVQPVREGYEAKRGMSYRDLYFWREMFRLYLETPIFYTETERRRGALTYKEARANLENYDKQLRETGLLEKMKTPQAKEAARRFLDLNLHILSIMHFQEMNSRAMAKILKKFNKRTHIEGNQFISNLAVKYPAITTKSSAGGFADSIARDMHAEIGSKVLAIVPQLDDWICPVCYGMAWRPVNLGCCRSVFCIRCIIKLQDQDMKRCPMCNTESVLKANGANIDFETMEFLEKYFPMEVKKRQKENERAQLVRDYGEEFVKPSCSVM
ncbi:Putative Zinc finger, RING-type, SPX domain, Zinc finger, RING/FYVE/PHD-type [Septoria linicola]|uniref:Zinc finger, RING-type, SPX domain, Zinc finger, RING/FYVE/PHD-type n=1 Tax=Septoria linicola TaxID=215465 RepID=A0A9Q9BA11_9PEZI|nr:putative Zinc finger, RING-type, SPX domain, Zinc finger, RING/FYVE/PHD-type [Septoria linicola]USW59111.1 Putative Zinc finger, RING-type, SPX domain, Zinc finger, RING/FYVE/PHD-type [Septoria linicola]